VALAKELGDGWVPLSRGEPAVVEELRAARDWPARPMTVVRITWMIVGETREDVMPEAEEAYEKVRTTATLTVPPTFEEFLAREVIGTASECRARIEQLERSGIDYHLVTFASDDQQERVARLLLPLL
jgi:alkanesulfonate monooxygenase SsuD/methylene tetrahydromethanopterin reductase-like flavin-dependent oxidoreductase (luciferase family)